MAGLYGNNHGTLSLSPALPSHRARKIDQPSTRALQQAVDRIVWVAMKTKNPLKQLKLSVPVQETPITSFLWVTFIIFFIELLNFQTSGAIYAVLQLKSMLNLIWSRRFFQWVAVGDLFQTLPSRKKKKGISSSKAENSGKEFGSCVWYKHLERIELYDVLWSRNENIGNVIKNGVSSKGNKKKKMFVRCLPVLSVFSFCIWNLIWLKFRTASGTFHEGGLLLNQKGLRIISEEDESHVS